MTHTAAAAVWRLGASNGAVGARGRRPPPAAMAPAGTSAGGTYCSPIITPSACGPVENRAGLGRGGGAAGPQTKICPVCGVTFRVRASRGAQETCSRSHSDLQRRLVPRKGDHTAEFKAKFAALWAIEPPLPKHVIAERLGITANGVAGLRSRMGLPPRPPKPRKAKPKRRMANARPTVTAFRVQAARVKAAKPAQPPIRVDRMPGQGCQWPTSDSPWRICEAVREPGQSYCLSHCHTAYPNFRARLAA